MEKKIIVERKGQVFFCREKQKENLAAKFSFKSLLKAIASTTDWGNVSTPMSIVIDLKQNPKMLIRYRQQKFESYL